MKQIFNQKEESVELFFKKHKLKDNEQIRQFLKIRFSILLKSYQQQEKQSLPESRTKSKNYLFAKNFTESESELIKSIIEFLN